MSELDICTFTDLPSISFFVASLPEADEDEVTRISQKCRVGDLEIQEYLRFISIVFSYKHPGYIVHYEHNEQEYTGTLFNYYFLLRFNPADHISKLNKEFGGNDKIFDEEKARTKILQIKSEVDRIFVTDWEKYYRQATEYALILGLSEYNFPQICDIFTAVTPLPFSTLMKRKIHSIIKEKNLHTSTSVAHHDIFELVMKDVANAFYGTIMEIVFKISPPLEREEEARNILKVWVLPDIIESNSILEAAGSFSFLKDGTFFKEGVMLLCTL